MLSGGETVMLPRRDTGDDQKTVTVWPDHPRLFPMGVPNSATRPRPNRQGHPTGEKEGIE